MVKPCDETTEQSRILWEQLADDWDERMGDTDNQYHREIIRPATLKLLNPHSGEYILDAACGNGNFSRFMAGMGVKVTAFDFSPTLIEHAKRRCRKYAHLIDFHVADATQYTDLIQLQPNTPFDKAVSNMAVMDIPDISPLMRAVYEMLKPGGIFVFSGVHPCFQTPNMRKFTEINDYTGQPFTRMGIQTYEYIHPKQHEVTALARNGKRILHFHRPLSLILNTCFEAGFMLDGIEEPVFEQRNETAGFDWFDIPPSVILRLRK